MGKVESAQTANSGIGLGGILTIIFVIAKLAGVIGWSWWWVFSPLWIGFFIAIGLLIIIFGIAAVVALIAALFD